MNKLNFSFCHWPNILDIVKSSNNKSELKSEKCLEWMSFFFFLFYHVL